MSKEPQTTPLNFRVIPRSGKGKAFLLVKCALNMDGECRFPLAPKRIPEFVWEWDGNIAKPTISPSIVCRMIGCGRHFTVIDGVTA